MSFDLDKKKEHEKSAHKAVVESNFQMAFRHTAKAAKYGLYLAEKSDGDVAKAYLDDANSLIDLAKELKQKDKSNYIKENKKKSVPENDIDESKSKFILKGRPNIKLDDVIGLDDVKEFLYSQVISYLNNKDNHNRYKQEGGCFVLLYGPPGNGKTYIASALAGELGVDTYPLPMNMIENKYYGETEKNIYKFFNKVRASKKSLILLDEMDSLIPNRVRGKLNYIFPFITEFYRIKENNSSKVIVLGITNRPWAIDPAIIRQSRFFYHRIYIGLPERERREGLIRQNLKGVPVNDDINYATLAKKTEGYSAADITLLCKIAKQKPLERHIKSGIEDYVTNLDILEALSEVKPSVHQDDIKKIKDWAGIE